MQIGDIVDAVNAELAAAGVGAFAADDGGSLRLNTTAFGSQAQITVASSLSDDSSGQRTGFDLAGASDSGVDVVGRIDGLDAAGSGRFLTAAEGSAAAGLLLEVTATAGDVVTTGGDFGTVSYSRGLVDTLVRRLDEMTRFDSGPLDLARDNLDENIDRLDEDIARIEQRLVLREARLLKTFTAAEQAISMLQAQQSQMLSGFRS
jgi:flagellar hook-associated protein 2